MQILILLRYFICILFILTFTGKIKSQNRIDNPLLFQTWNFKGLGPLSSTFENSKTLVDNNLSFKLKKNGKVVANWIETGCFVGETKFNFKRMKGSWKKISDSVISINFISNVSLAGSHFISNLTKNELTLKKFVNTNKKQSQRLSL